jgi:4-hydroxy-3-methylbut-2-enyl diphosphate reductase
MALKIERAGRTGFCFGVRRAIDMLKEVASEQGSVETLGPLVHNHLVVDRLAKMGIKEVKDMDSFEGDTVAISAHGVGPKLEDKITAEYAKVINTTCPFVHRAQTVAKRLEEAGFLVVIYGDAKHAEVKGILAWAEDKGIATVDAGDITSLSSLPRRIGVISQTTRVPSNFNEFVKKVVDVAFGRNSELRIIDTICHDIIQRQTDAFHLAKKVDLMFVLGSSTSANTKHLTELCSTVVKTYQVETADAIQCSWLKGKSHIGVAAGASTGEQTIDEVVVKLKSMDEKLKG